VSESCVNKLISANLAYSLPPHLQKRRRRLGGRRSWQSSGELRGFWDSRSRELQSSRFQRKRTCEHCRILGGDKWWYIFQASQLRRYFRKHYHRRFFVFFSNLARLKDWPNFSKEKRRVSLVEKIILKKQICLKFSSKKKKKKKKNAD
jgi:hypothetical protein